MNIFIIIVVIITISLFLLRDKKEGYNGSLLQLVAKGPQDTYLTGDAWKYMPYYFGYNYPWYNMTRPKRYYRYHYPRYHHPKYRMIRARPRFNWYSPWGRVYY